MAWRLTAGGGGKLNMIKMINAGPYRGGLCEFGHRVPGPVPRPVPNSFTGWGGQQTDPDFHIGDSESSEEAFNNPAFLQGWVIPPASCS